VSTPTAAPASVAAPGDTCLARSNTESPVAVISVGEPPSVEGSVDGSSDPAAVSRLLSRPRRR
jgi:hypothetical protein